MLNVKLIVCFDYKSMTCLLTSARNLRGHVPTRNLGSTTYLLAKNLAIGKFTFGNKYEIANWS